MDKLIFVVLGMVAVGGWLVWRFSSRRLNVPCPVWLGWMLERENPFTKANRAKVIIEHLGLEAGMKVLDAGCGPGRLTIPIAERIGSEGEVTAVDIQSGMLKRVEKKARTAKLQNIQFLEAGVGDGKLEHSQYDRAVLVTVLGEIPDRTAALREIYDALKPGGILSVTEVIFDPHFQGVKTIRHFANSVGFQENCFIGNRFAFTMQLVKPS